MKRYISAKSLAGSRLRDSWAAELRKREDEKVKREETGERRGGGAFNLFLRDGPSETFWGGGVFSSRRNFFGIPSDWSDLTDCINTLKAGRSERWHAASTRVK